MKTRDELLLENPLDKFIERRGVKLVGNGRQRTTNICPNATHKDKHLCVSIDIDQQIFRCHDCGVGGSIIDWMMIETNQTAAQVLAYLNPPDNSPPVPSTEPAVKAIYEYVNESRVLVYQVVRYEPKTFRQKRPDGSGGWIWNMEGVERVLFNLPDVLAAATVVICEGEKDCLTAGQFGFTSTCNVGGAGKWLAAYSCALTGKDVIIFPDNDEVGRKHADAILASISEVANSVKIVPIPSPYKDLTDFIDSFPDHDTAERELNALIERVAHIVAPAPLYSLQEMEQRYREQLQRQTEQQFNLSNWLPALGDQVHPLVPGEMLLVIADTGVGKTMILQNMIRSARPMPCLLFEMELPLGLVFERFVQMEIGCLRSDVQEEYRTQSAPLYSRYTGLQHITVCPESGLSLDQIEKYILRSELKIGTRPVIVAIDYVGLVRNQAKSRYESISNVAEQLKVIAKRTNVIMLVASQIARPDKNKQESLSISLHDAKDSGSLEASAGVVIGAWRPERTRMMLRILKNTSGTGGETIEARVEGGTMRITSMTNGTTNQHPQI